MKILFLALSLSLVAMACEKELLTKRDLVFEQTSDPLQFVARDVSPPGDVIVKIGAQTDPSPAMLAATPMQAAPPMWLHRRKYDTNSNLLAWIRWNGSTIFTRYVPFNEVAFDILTGLIPAADFNASVIQTWVSDAASFSTAVTPLTSGDRTEYLGFDPVSGKTFYIYNNFPAGAKNPSVYADRLVALIDSFGG